MSEGDPARLEPAVVFTRLADIIYAQHDYDEVGTAICLAATLLVPGCDHASLMLRQGGRFPTVAASDGVARRIDELERGLGEGPCIDAIEDEAASIASDLAGTTQWPRLARDILEHTPVRSAAGFRLVVDGRKIGALNLFSDTPGSFAGHATDQGAILAAFAAMALRALAHQERADTLRRGLESNREIGKAIGLLMALHHVSDEQAFDLLRRASQDMNIKLAEVARRVVHLHTMPDGGQLQAPDTHGS